MQKKLLSLLLFSILSTLAYSQKKGKMAIPIIEEKIETSQWESKKTKQIKSNSYGFKLKKKPLAQF